MKCKPYILIFLSVICSYQAISQPIVSSFSPVSGPIGTPVTIYGTNFSATVSNNIVYFGAVRASVSSASTTTLTVTVPTGTTFSPITVTTSNLTAYSSKPFVVTFTNSAGLDFTSASLANYIALSSYGPVSVAVGDIDRDGKVDIIQGTNMNTGIYIYRNTSTANTISFAAPIELWIEGTTAHGIAIGDLDGDGKLDIAVANGIANRIDIFRNESTSGNISFAPKSQLVTGVAFDVAIGDINGDGKLDIAYPNQNNGNVTIQKNTSTPGTISFIPTTIVTTPNLPTKIAIGDIDGDGKADLLISGSTISVCRNTSTSSTISFAAISNFTSSSGSNITIGDLDGDDKADIVSVSNSGNISVLRNVGGPGAVAFATTQAIGIGNDIKLSDMNGDGKLEIVANTGYSAILYKNNSSSGTISFAGGVNSSTMDPSAGASTFCQVNVADFDGDGKADIVATSRGIDIVGIFKNQVGTSLPLALSYFGCNSQGLLVNIEWHTESEQNTSHFFIEHSLDGILFSTIGKINASSNSSTTKKYSFTHGNPNKGINYYRLKTMDADGKFDYSKVVNAKVDGNKGLVVYPNPARDNFIVQNLFSVRNTEMKIIDAAGKTIKTIIVPHDTKRINVPIKGIPQGTYLVVWSNGIEKYTKVLLIQ
jgi:hypothetical protein